MRSPDAVLESELPATPTVQEAEINAMVGMLDYLIPQARLVSPQIAMYLHLARHELILISNIGSGRVTRFLS